MTCLACVTTLTLETDANCDLTVDPSSGNRGRLCYGLNYTITLAGSSKNYTVRKAASTNCGLQGVWRLETGAGELEHAKTHDGMLTCGSNHWRIASRSEQCNRITLATEQKWIYIGMSRILPLALIALMSIFLIAFTLVLTYCFSHRQVITLSSWRFNIIVGVGCIFLLVANVLQGFDEGIAKALNMCDISVGGRCLDTERVCMVTWSLKCISYTLIVCPLVLKMYRVHRIFNAKDQGALPSLSDVKLLVVLAVFLLFDLILIIVHQTISPFNRTERGKNIILEVNTEIDQTFVKIEQKWFECSSSQDTTFNQLLSVFIGIMLGIGSYFAYQTTSIKIPQVNDSSEIEFSLYTAAMCFGFMAIISHIKTDYREEYVIVAYLTNFVVMVITYKLFHKSLGSVCKQPDSDRELKSIMDFIHTDVTRRSKPTQPQVFQEGIEITSLAATERSDVTVAGSFAEKYDSNIFDDDDAFLDGHMKTGATLRSMHTAAVPMDTAPAPTIILDSDIPRISLAVPLDRAQGSLLGNARRAPRAAANKMRPGVPRAKTVPREHRLKHDRTHKRANSLPLTNMYSTAVSVHDVGTIRSLEAAVGADIPNIDEPEFVDADVLEGARVRVKGLKKARRYNGVFGTIQGKKGSKWLVILDTGVKLALRRHIWTSYRVAMRVMMVPKRDPIHSVPDSKCERCYSQSANNHCVSDYFDLYSLYIQRIYFRYNISVTSITIYITTDNMFVNNPSNQTKFSLF